MKNVRAFYQRFGLTNNWLVFLGLSIVLGLSLESCDEIAPVLNVQEAGNPIDPGTTALADQPRGVLIEEFTGIRCVQCPAGAEAIAQLKVIHGKQLVPVALHTGFFANPYPNESNVDFRSADANAIEVFLGAPQGYPSAVIDRTEFDGENGFQTGRGSWAGLIGLNLQDNPAVAIGLDASIGADSSQIEFEIDLLGTTGTNGREVFFTLIVLENNIVDVQLTPEGKDFEYAHQHVMRDIVTAPTGEQIGAIASGQLVERSYTFDIPADYVADNLEFAAFVHYKDSEEDGKAVLQAVGKTMGQ